MKIADVIKEIENFAPPSLQESYDNAGLIVGDRNILLKGILICLDSIEAVVDEAITKNCNLIVAHHPIVFAGLKRFNGNNYIERIIIKAIKNDIAIYAAHTNLDNVVDGVNAMIAKKIGLSNTKILSPKANILRKLHTYVPTDHLANIQDAIFKAGAGHIGNYDECSFSFEGKGSFRAGDHANAFVGQKGQRHFEPETKIEVIYPSYNERKVISALKLSHPYEEVAYDIIPINNKNESIGSGMIGELAYPMNELDFLNHLKKNMNVEVIRHTQLANKLISKVAVCGGSGSFLLNTAIGQSADIFITGDFKYHQFFDAEDKIIIADIGHYESEQYTNELFYNLLKKKFSNFALRITEINTNPIKYF
jgi:dinuclear metal center YbgI/SA1388 family protein